MIFVLLSVWIDPSFFCRNPRTVHMRSLNEIDPKLLFHSFAELGALHFLKQGRKMSLDLERVRRM